ncbi:chromate transporter [Mycoplasma sp. Ms02]|uniref:chromate transporter n=1 Tax=Mycoplasma sp. Ms02 TaxID=353851 RepID=UPI001C8A3FC2|nr:chromate transporter [Mycoplasma sp. Ms02]QZE12342.1 chromate transporter [Mycoplasma sp. Ms02]
MPNNSKVSTWEIVLFVLKVTFFGFGGGNALMPIIRTEAVKVKNWLTETEFDKVVIVTNMLPGPSVIQALSYVCIKLKGKFIGSLICLLSLLPHILMALAIYVGASYLAPKYLFVLSTGVIVVIICMLINFMIRYIKASNQVFKLPFWIVVAVFTFAYCLFVPSPFNLPIIPIAIVVVGSVIQYFIVQKKASIT